MAEEKEKPVSDEAFKARVLGELMEITRGLGDGAERMGRIEENSRRMDATLDQIRKDLDKHTPQIETLMMWRNDSLFVRKIIDWVITKGPTVAAIAVFLLWVANQWNKGVAP